MLLSGKRCPFSGICHIAPKDGSPSRKQNALSFNSVVFPDQRQIQFSPYLPRTHQGATRINEWENESRCPSLIRVALIQSFQVQEAKMVMEKPNQSISVEPLGVCYTNLRCSTHPFIFMDIPWLWDKELAKEIFVFNFTTWYSSCTWPLRLVFHRTGRHPFKTATQLRASVPSQYRNGSHPQTRYSSTLKHEHNTWKSRGQRLQDAHFFPGNLS